MNILYSLSPKTAVKLMFFLRKGYPLNLSSPVTYNEKLNWMKLYYRDDLIPLCADKYTVRQYIKDCGYEELLNELLWEGFDANEIPFAKLPRQFVAKVTHGSGMNIICKNKEQLNIKHTIKMLNKWLKEKYLPCYGEWFYGQVKPRIIIEKFLSEDGHTEPIDYKLYYFNNVHGSGNVGCTEVISDRFIHKKITMYDSKWNLLSQVPARNSVLTRHAKPKYYSQMVEITKKLAKPFIHARVDFYIVKDKLYVGEITFLAAAGFDYYPKHIDLMMGSWIKLPGGGNR
jgi:hypothetical protein